MKLKEIADKIGGKVFGNSEVEIEGVASIETAKKGFITFIRSKKFIQSLKHSKASAVITGKYIKDIDIPQVVVENPLYAFAKVLEIFYKFSYKPQGILKGAYVSNTATIGKDVTIYSNVYIADSAFIGDRTVIYPGVFVGEKTIIGSDCIIYPNVTIREGVKIGSRVIIHSSSVIGSDGFGYVMNKGKHYKIPQVGSVVIEDDVEIGACVTIDRATIGETFIGKGTKIDNLVQIAHNVRIGKHSIIVAQVGIAGSSKIGEYVTLAGQVGIADHVDIEDGCIIAAKSGVMRNLKKGVYSGIPAIVHNKWLKIQVILEKLPELYKKIKELDAKISSGGK